MQEPAPEEVTRNVAAALAEDIGSGDISADLISENVAANATVTTRDNGVFCGQPWISEVCRQIDELIEIDWHVEDGDNVEAGQALFSLSGPARSLLTAERSMLNFAQLLSGVATAAHRFVELIDGTNVTILDTRKTLPGLRVAQKYAVRAGGASNHRMGLYDAFLIKENHIAAAGSIINAINTARAMHPGKNVEVEVENFEQLHEALQAEADIIMLDNFSIDAMAEAVAQTAGRAKLEASGGITDEELPAIANTGVDYVSIGAITKEVVPLDLSMLFKN